MKPSELIVSYLTKGNITIYMNNCIFQEKNYLKKENFCLCFDLQSPHFLKQWSCDFCAHTYM